MKNLSFLVILFLAFFGCRNDIDEITNGETTTEPPIIISEYNPESDLVTGTIFGRVYDEQENPIANAQVKYDGKNYTTDEEGRFFIIDEVLDKNGTFFTVEADGYFKGSRRFNPQDGSVSYAYVQLLELSTIGTFNANEGGKVSDDFMSIVINPMSIEFPPNSVATENGELYSGEVTVAAKYLDPTAPNIGEFMPGNLLGLNNQIEEVSLVSYGMMAVELFGENGEKLNIAEGQTATLSFPIPAELLNSAPDEIPLWSFEDEQYGIWAEEGSATLQNGMYVGEVSHFSFWNCDAPFDLVFIEGQLLGANGIPIVNASVEIRIEGSASGRYGYTNNRGIFSGKMPKGENLTLRVGSFGQASCEFGAINLGSFDIDTNIGPIILQESGEAFTVTGTITGCFNNSIENGLIKIEMDGVRTDIYLREESEFELSIINCDNVTEVSITAIDLNNLTEGPTITLPIIPEVNFDEITTCGNSLSEFFTLIVDGVSETYIDGINTGFNNLETGEDGTIIISQQLDSLNNPLLLLSTYNIGSVETYPISELKWLTFNLPSPPFNENARFNYVDDDGFREALSEFTLIIHEYGGPNGHIAGEFNGVGTFTNRDDEDITYEYSFSGLFRLPIQ